MFKAVSGVLMFCVGVGFCDADDDNGDEFRGDGDDDDDDEFCGGGRI